MSNEAIHDEAARRGLERIRVMSRETGWNTVCPGWRQNKTGERGVCCCGLYWEGVMPLHTADGRIIKDAERVMARWSKREIELDEFDAQRRASRPRRMGLFA
jgi:hypothetical protein